MKLLLDTHTLIWAIYTSKKLSAVASKNIADPENAILVSAASAWEVATKCRLGRLPEAEWLERDFTEALDDAGYEILSISADHALRAGRLPGAHQDPFDRMFAAQALSLDIPIISNDAKLDSFGVRRIW